MNVKLEWCKFKAAFNYDKCKLRLLMAELTEKVDSDSDNYDLMRADRRKVRAASLDLDIATAICYMLGEPMIHPRQVAAVLFFAACVGSLFLI